MTTGAIAVVCDIQVGGLSRHVQEMARAWSQYCCVIWVEYRDRILVISVFEKGKNIRIETVQDGTFQMVRELFRAYRVSLLHIHSFFRMTRELHHFYESLAMPYVYTAHDYYVVCPISVMLRNGRYCGDETNVDVCRKCLREGHKQPYRYQRNVCIDIQEWRQMHGDLMVRAAFVAVPSEDVRSRLALYYPGLDIRLRENPEVVPPPVQIERKTASAKKLIHIGLLGRISMIKGRNVVSEVVALAEKLHPNLVFYVFGELKPPVKPVKKNLRVLGTYKDGEVYQQILSHDIDFFWFPPICPETYSYVLTIPIRLRIPVIGVDLGAIGARIKGNKWGETYDWQLQPKNILARLVSFPYSDWKKRADFVIRNDHFPTMEEFYGSAWQPSPDSPDQQLADSILQELQHSRSAICLKRLTWYELKTLLRWRTGFFERLKTLAAFDPVSLWRDLRHAGIKNILNHLRAGYF